MNAGLMRTIGKRLQTEMALHQLLSQIRATELLPLQLVLFGHQDSPFTTMATGAATLALGVTHRRSF